MAICTVVCHACGLVQHGPDPKAIDYRVVVRNGRLRPLCGACYAATRDKPKPLEAKQC